MTGGDQGADTDTTLRGREVCITGRLWTMDHRRARSLLREHGARTSALPGIGTHFVVVGEAGPPLGADGRPTRALLLAEQHRCAGHPLRLLRETEFLSLLGLEEQRRDLERLYPVDQLARILGLATATVRQWVRAGLIQPAKVEGRLALFAFPQVAAARDLSRLTAAGVTPSQLHRSLHQIRAWLPDGERALGQLEMLSRNEIGVRLADGLVAETTGQLRLQFEGWPQQGRTDGAPPIAAAAPGVATASPAEPPPATVHRDWFAAGVQAEEAGDIHRAIHAYRQALLSGGPQPETSFNLGNCYYASEELDAAVELYTRAVNIDPSYSEAWNNLGNALSDLERTDEAVAAYHRALAASPDYADAHYNLAETLAWLGDLATARVHWRAYLERDPNSSWARRVRQRLREAGTSDLGSSEAGTTD